MKSQANSTWYVNRGLTVYRFQQFGSGLDFHKRFGSARFGSGSDFFKQFGSVSVWFQQLTNCGLNGSTLTLSNQTKPLSIVTHPHNINIRT